MARSRYRIRSPNYPHFLTCTITLFNDPETDQIILNSWSFLQDQDRLRLYGYVILENHLHFIADSADLAREVANFKSFTALRILDLLQKRADSICSINCILANNHLNMTGHIRSGRKGAIQR